MKIFKLESQVDLKRNIGKYYLSVIKNNVKRKMLKVMK
jgi:hypothetical protein